MCAGCTRDVYDHTPGLWLLIAIYPVRDESRIMTYFFVYLMNRFLCAMLIVQLYRRCNLSSHRKYHSVEHHWDPLCPLAPCSHILSSYRVLAFSNRGLHLAFVMRLDNNVTRAVDFALVYKVSTFTVFTHTPHRKTGLVANRATALQATTDRPITISGLRTPSFTRLRCRLPHTNIVQYL